MISIDDFLYYLDDALDGMVHIVCELGDELANRRPDLPGANSPFAILTHCLGVMEYWGGETVAGRRIVRDRPAEFRATGRVGELAAATERARQRLRTDVAAIDPFAPPRGQPRRAEDTTLPLGRTQGGALLHIYEELAQHRGQMEITRDLLQAPWARLRSDQGEERGMTDAMRAETVTITGHAGDRIEAYVARPLGGDQRGGVVVIHHMPGYDGATKEIVRRFAAEGYPALCPNLYYREAPGADPDDAAATVRAAGGVPDERLVGDVAGAAAYLKSLDGANGKIGVIGYCSGGRQTFLAACSLPVDAAVDCYGAFVVNDPPPGRPKNLQPILHLAPQLSGPLLGLFGADDQYPSPAETAVLAAELDRLGKKYEFHTYDGAGHAFFAVDRPSYRPEAAVDGWRRILDFFRTYLTT